MRIVICCLGGASSSCVARRLEEGVAELGMDDRVSFTFMAFSLLANRQDKFDIAMICPHQEYEIKARANEFHIPVYVIPMVMYGTMPAKDLVEDAEDLLEVWKNGATNPITFPDEPRSMTCGRTTSHRRVSGAMSA